MQGGASAGEQEVAKGRFRRPERDAVDAAAVLAFEGQLDMVGADLAAVAQPVLGEGEDGLRMVEITTALYESARVGRSVMV